MNAATEQASYSVRDASRLLKVSPRRIRSYIRAGIITPEVGRNREYRFGFQDLVLLRTAQDLSQRIGPQRVQRILSRLADQMPANRNLSEVRLETSGDDVVACDGDRSWNPESGQRLLGFRLGEGAKICVMEPVEEEVSIVDNADAPDASSWFELGCELEDTDPEYARDAYRRALELNPRHADARLNLGRLLHNDGQLATAQAHYMMALNESPTDATTLFNLGVVLEDQGQNQEAIEAYEKSITVDPHCPDAHYNVARLMDQEGDEQGSLRHLQIFRKLTQ